MRDGNAPREGLTASAQTLTGGRTRTSFHESTLANTIHENSKGGKKARKTWLWLLHAVQDESWTSHPPANQLLNLRKLGTKKWRNLRERCWSTWTSLTSIDVGKKKISNIHFLWAGRTMQLQNNVILHWTEKLSKTTAIKYSRSYLSGSLCRSERWDRCSTPHPVLQCRPFHSTGMCSGISWIRKLYLQLQRSQPLQNSHMLH